MQFIENKQAFVNNRLTALKRSLLSQLKRVMVKLDFYLANEVNLQDLNLVLENIDFEVLDLAEIVPKV